MAIKKQLQLERSQVAGTNSFSTISKYSIVQKGYCQDDYLRYFVGQNQPGVRSPIINYGYYVRFKAIEFGWNKVLSLDKKNIIISLGSGFDTSPFRYNFH